MPDKLQDLMMNRPLNVTGDIQYPKQGDPGVVDDKVMRALGVATGIDEQQPGDAAGAIGGILGAVSMIPPGLAAARGAKLIEHAKATEQFPAHIIEALEDAQKRWPRLFGHTSEIRPVTKPSVIGEELPAGRSVPSGYDTKVMQKAYPGMKKDSLKGLVSAMELNPDQLTNKQTASQTIGHEMLHGADALVDPDSLNKYFFNNELPGGYASNSQEVRARLQGARSEAYSHGLGRRDFYPETSPNKNRSVIVMEDKSAPPPPPKQTSLYDKLFQLINPRKE